jgi:serine phosphatase RsbU (regulator of sigma subunit)
VAGILEPAYDVGGDAFDYAINGDVAHIAIVDAMGHALEASQMSTVAIGAYRHSRRLRSALADTHRAMDAVVAEQFGADRFATGQLAELHLDTGELTLLNAGHPAPLLVGADGRSRPVPCSPSLPMGLGIDQEPALATVQLEPGDRLLLFSDGLIERRRVDLAASLESLRAVVGAGPVDPHELLDDVLARLNPPGSDDVTLVAVART